MSQMEEQPIAWETHLHLPPNGGAAATLLAAGIGCCVLGLLTPLAEALGTLSNLLTWYRPVGKLSGLSSIAVILWLICWLILYQRWKNTQVRFSRIFIITLVLIAIGLLGTFPPFFDAVANVLRTGA